MLLLGERRRFYADENRHKPKGPSALQLGICNITFLSLNDQYTILRRDSNPPKQSHASLMKRALYLQATTAGFRRDLFVRINLFHRKNDFHYINT